MTIKAKDVLKVIFGGLIFGIIAFAIHFISSILTMGYYTDPALSAVWSKLMMPTAGPPPMSFFYYSFAFNWLTGILFAGVYVAARDSMKEISAAKKGMGFGFLVFMAAGVPGMLSLYLLVNLPLTLILAWVIEGLIIYSIGGAAVGIAAKK